MERASGGQPQEPQGQLTAPRPRRQKKNKKQVRKKHKKRKSQRRGTITQNEQGKPDNLNNKYQVFSKGNQGIKA